jgi:hypothetical protein
MLVMLYMGISKVRLTGPISLLAWVILALDLKVILQRKVNSYYP